MYACNTCFKEYKNANSLASHRYKFHNSKRLSDDVKNVIDIQLGPEDEYIPIKLTKKVRKNDDGPKAQPNKKQDEMIENSLSGNFVKCTHAASRRGEARRQKKRGTYNTYKNDFRDDDYTFDDYFKLIRMLCRCILNRLIPLGKDHMSVLKKHEQFIRDVAYQSITEAKKTMLINQYALDIVLKIIAPLLPDRFSHI